MAKPASRSGSILAPSLPTLSSRMQQRSTRRIRSLQDQLRSAGLSNDSVLPWLKPLPPLPVLKFPTMEELIAQEVSGPPVAADNGLFSQLVGDPLVLYREYLDDPDRFDESLGLLLQELVTNRKKLEELTGQEVEQLNKATVELAQYEPKPKKQPAPQPRASASSEDSYEGEEEEVPWKGVGPSLPEMPMTAELPTAPSFWWKKS